MTQVTLLGHGINWTWYLKGEVKGRKITVERYWRVHNSEPDTEHPHTSHRIEGLREDASKGDRTLVSVKFGGKSYKLTNPDHIFSFDCSKGFIPS